ncbi:tail fiber assembly protein [Burkholderia plantarii]|uniref:tail fiber assembly protein n=1 Tax=Burkholderia plantarii TaxID=41899 RepID=UPI000706C685|nr:tail fiber assembly protein [Burkholderia plantarii]ALK30470.1 tail assembly chaperone gp38 [Burkholderia plantarii]GLZ19856.1 hypothetical protein Bpla01_33850 [Burkholderia plantarii]
MGNLFAVYDGNDPCHFITGFYDSDIVQVPEGAASVRLSVEEYNYLLQVPAGQRQALDENLKPVWLTAPPPSSAQAAAFMRASRDAVLRATDWLVARHQDEKLLGRGTTLTADQFAILLNYRQVLRECSDMPNWPDITLPTLPPFLSNQDDTIKQTAREAPRMQKNP